MNLDRAIAETFALLEAVVPNFPEPSKKAKAMQVWKLVLEAEQVTPQELKAALTDYLRTGKFMPAPSEILERVVKLNVHSRILDPVKTGEFGGVPEIGSRERCEALGLHYQEIRESTPELPAELRAEANERLASLEKKLENLPVKRMPKAARERSEKVEEVDEELVKRRSTMVSKLRGTG